MSTLKEQIDLIQQNQEENKQLEKELQDILYSREAKKTPDFNRGMNSRKPRS